MLTKLKRLAAKFLGFIKRYSRSLVKTRDKKTIAATSLVVACLALIVISIATSAPNNPNSKVQQKANKHSIGRANDNSNRKNNDNKTKSTKAGDEIRSDSDNNNTSTNKMYERVERGVKNKRITEAQAKLIYAKIDEMEKFQKDIAGKPIDEQRTLISQKTEELYKWAKDNKVSLSYVRIRS